MPGDQAPGHERQPQRLETLTRRERSGSEGDSGQVLRDSGEVRERHQEQFRGLHASTQVHA
jgi:hypothetical protein